MQGSVLLRGVSKLWLILKSSAELLQCFYPLVFHLWARQDNGFASTDAPATEEEKRSSSPNPVALLKAAGS